MGHGQGRVDDDRAEEVGEQVFREDPEGCRAGRLSGLDEGLFLEAEDLAPDDAGHGQPAHAADREQQRSDIEQQPAGFLDLHAAAGDPSLDECLARHREQDDEQDVGEPVEDIHDPHQYGVGLAADVPGQAAVERADEHRDERSGDPDAQRDPAAGEDAGQEGAAQHIGAEPISRGPAGRLFDRVEPFLLQCIGGPPERGEAPLLRIARVVAWDGGPLLPAGGPKRPRQRQDARRDHQHEEPDPEHPRETPRERVVAIDRRGAHRRDGFGLGLPGRGV